MIKKARYLAILPANKNYWCFNIVSSTGMILDKDLINVLQCCKKFISKTRVKNLIKKYCKYSEFKSSYIINELIKNNVFISNTNMRYDNFKENLIVVGFSYNPLNAISVEAYTILVNCDYIVSICPTEFNKNILKRFNKNIIDLSEYFVNELKRGKNAHLKIAKEYVKMVVFKKNTIFITHSNPVLGEDITHYIYQIAKNNNIPVRIISGQSSLEFIFKELKFDAFNRNLTIIKSDLFLLKEAIKNDFPILIVLVGYSIYGSNYRFLNKNSYLRGVVKELKSIKKVLLKKFPPSYLIYVITEFGIYQFNLSEIEKTCKIFIPGCTSIFVPTVHTSNPL